MLGILLELMRSSVFFLGIRRSARTLPCFQISRMVFLALSLELEPQKLVLSEAAECLGFLSSSMGTRSISESGRW